MVPVELLLGAGIERFQGFGKLDLDIDLGSPARASQN